VPPLDAVPGQIDHNLRDRECVVVVPPSGATGDQAELFELPQLVGRETNRVEQFLSRQPQRGMRGAEVLRRRGIVESIASS
jgi:hypothetical protein